MQKAILVSGQPMRHPYITKTWKVMKLTGILLFAMSLHVTAKVRSQTVDFTGKDVPLKTIFAEVETQTGFVFFYDGKDLLTARPVTITAHDLPLNNFLELVFINQPLKYRVDNRGIIVSIKSPAADLSPQLETARPPITVRGRIVNQIGEPVIASVLVKGTSYGTTSNSYGAFQLHNIDSKAILIISATNIEEVMVVVNGKSDLIVTVKTLSRSLEEVVINAGYYNTTSTTKTGNISKVNGKDIERQAIVNPILALQSRMPGVEIVQNSGVPGTAIQIRIRGINSLRPDGNNPLYIIDGVPVESSKLQSNGLLTATQGFDPLNTINLANIESIEVLKDADALAIYGSRGANGVVLITTKKAKSGDGNLDIGVYSGVARVSKMMDLLDTKQYLELRNEALKNSAITASTILPDIDLLNWDTTRYTDWQKKLFGGAAKVNDAQISFSGGNNNTNFRLGGGYHKESSVFPGDFGYEKWMGNFVLNHSSTSKRLNAGLSFNFGTDQNNLYSGNPVAAALKLAPIAPHVYQENGNLNWQNSTWVNPFAAFLIDQTSKSKNIVTSANVNYQLLKGLTIRANIGFNNLDFEETINTPKKSIDPNQLTGFLSSTGLRMNNTSSWVIEPQLNYINTFRKSRLEIIIGSTLQDRKSYFRSFEGTGFLNDDLLGNLAAATTVRATDYNEIKYRYIAGFGRIGYNLSEKYIFNITGRRDGSSRFGSQKQFANFGALGAAWIFSNEEFIANHFSIMSFGKLRGSYGTTGSDQIGDYGYLDLYTTTGYAIQNGVGLYPTQFSNQNYAWEVNKKLELALELGLLNNSISLELSWYKNRSSNQLVGFNLPVFTGFGTVQGNLPATVQNSGWEILVSTIPMNNKNFEWRISANLTIPENKLIRYDDLKNSTYADSYVIGSPLNMVKLYKFEGIDPQTGEYKILDFNKDGVYSNEDKVVNQNLGRRFYGGLSNSLRFKNVRLDFLFEYVNQTGYGYINSFGYPGIGPDYDLGGNQPDVVLNRWQKPGDLTNVQRVSYDNNTLFNHIYVQSSDLSVKDASFFRLKTLSLSWQLPQNFLTGAHIRDLKIYVQGQNLVTFTKYIGLDPQFPGGTNLPALTSVTAGIQFKL